MQNEGGESARKSADIEDRLFELVKQSMHCRIVGLVVTSLDNLCVPERLELPIMPKLAQRKARETLFTNLRSS